MVSRISGGGKLGSVEDVGWYRGCFWVDFCCGRVECNPGSSVRLGEEFWEVSEEFGALVCSGEEEEELRFFW